MSIPPLEFLLDASMQSLQDLELVALNHSANLSKALRVELQAWVERQAAAAVARWFLENREALLQHASLRIELKPKKADFFDVEENKKSA